MNNNIKHANIMIVDDEPANVRLLEKMLDFSGYKNVVSTSDPYKVLPMFEKHNCDLILLDLNMPELDGYGVIEQLQQIAKETLPPILVLTAQNAKDFRQRALNNGARDFVSKPFDADELLSRVHNLLDMQLAHKFMQQQNEILEQKVLLRTQLITDTRLHIVRCLGRAAEYRDNETGLHIIRMSKVAVVLGKAAGMDEEQCDLLLNAAPMHDIGKIGIPDRILLKPGKLDAEEWECMKTHTQIGADILSNDDSELMQMAHAIALTHHEKWNGKGYPAGLAGADIPLVGRVTALADVFDALISERPYKKPWSLEKAMNLIQSESGQHFDPALVEIFMDHIPAILEINKKYAEPEMETSMDSENLTDLNSTTQGPATELGARNNEV